MKFLCIYVFLMLGAVFPALAEKRVALIIANSNYQNARDLSNPRNDAEAFASLLKTIGFSGGLTIKYDLGYDAMRREILAFSHEAEGASVALIYFAGHGLGSGVNYLIPVDAALRRARDLPNEAISQRLLEDAVKGAHGLKLVILDACRNDPADGRMSDLPATRSVDRGFEPVEPDGGVLVLYSAKHGTLAQDGPSGGNSPFALALIRRLAQPRDIRFVLGYIADDVKLATRGGQQPFFYGSIGGDEVYLVAPAKAPAIDGSSLEKNAGADLKVQPGKPISVRVLIEGAQSRLVETHIRLILRNGLRDPRLLHIVNDAEASHNLVIKSKVDHISGGDCPYQRVQQLDWSLLPVKNPKAPVIAGSSQGRACASNALSPEDWDVGPAKQAAGDMIARLNKLIE